LSLPRGARGCRKRPLNKPCLQNTSNSNHDSPDEQTEEPSDEPWSDLKLTIPHNRSPTAIVSLVECTLVELTHEDVGAEFVSTSVAGVKRTQYIATDDVGQRFQKRFFDERLSAGTKRQSVVKRFVTSWSADSHTSRHSATR